MIETDRLKLRPWRAADLPFLDTILGDADVMQFSDRGALGTHDQATWLDSARATMNPGQMLGTSAVERKQDARIIGYVSLSEDPARVGQGETEIGFRLARHAWEHGYAREALIGIIEAARSVSATERIVAIVDPNNIRSVNVLKKAGLTYEKDIVFEGYDHADHLYARDLTP